MSDPKVQSDDSVASSDPTDRASGSAVGVWTVGRLLLVILAVAMLAVTIGVYLNNNDIDPDLIEPRKLAALAVFAIIGGIGYRLSGRLGEKLILIIAALSAVAVVLMKVSNNSTLSPDRIKMGYMASQGIIALVFFLAGLCIFGGWIHFGFLRKRPSESTAPAEA